MFDSLACVLKHEIQMFFITFWNVFIVSPKSELQNNLIPPPIQIIKI